jgi:hypothetical protein
VGVNVRTECAQPPAPARSPDSALQAGAPATLSPTGVLALQRTAGNQAVQRLLARMPAASPERVESYRSANPKGIVPKLLEGIEAAKPDSAVLVDLLEAFRKVGFDYNMSNTETKRFLAGDTKSGDCQTLVRAFVEVAQGIGIADAKVIAGDRNFGIFEGPPRVTIDGKSGNCDRGTKWVFDDHYWVEAAGGVYDVLFGTVEVNKKGWVKQTIDPAKETGPYGRYYRGTYDTIDVYATGDTDVPNRYSIGPNKESIQRKEDADTRQKVLEAWTAARTGLDAVKNAVKTALTEGAPARAAEATWAKASQEAESKESKSRETAELKKQSLAGGEHEKELKRIGDVKRRELTWAEEARTEQSSPAYWADKAAGELDGSVVDKASKAIKIASGLSSAEERAKVLPMLEEAIRFAEAATAEAEGVKQLVTDKDPYESAAEALGEAKVALAKLKSPTEVKE